MKEKQSEGLPSWAIVAICAVIGAILFCCATSEITVRTPSSPPQTSFEIDTSQTESSMEVETSLFDSPEEILPTRTMHQDHTGEEHLFDVLPGESGLVSELITYNYDDLQEVEVLEIGTDCEVAFPPNDLSGFGVYCSDDDIVSFYSEEWGFSVWRLIEQ